MFCKRDKRPTLVVTRQERQELTQRATGAQREWKIENGNKEKSHNAEAKAAALVILGNGASPKARAGLPHSKS